ncbi:MAG: amino-acid N-acetyltransferase [Acidobacteria bacterium]|nr:MAG: amino-acid N-acetyltransferase [Acidobacteriota bacterium]
MRLTDLREILRYVPRFRERVFVIAVDGAVVEEDNFSNLLLDIALLRSLRIGVALVHGAGHQIRKLAELTRQEPSNIDGTGITDAATLQLALTAANRVTHEILEGLGIHDLRAAYSNALVAHPAGILQAIDYQFTGRVERVDVVLLQALLERDIVPVIPPLGCDGEGNTYRLNSDAVAVEVARALHAVKLIYLTNYPGIECGGELLRQLTIEEAEDILKERRNQINPAVLSKLENALRAARGGVPRVHIIDGRVEEGLLAEVFSNEGIGTLVYANEYRQIRRARRRDVRSIQQLIQASVESDELLPRSRAAIERQLDDYYIFELDRNPVACIALHVFPEERKGELACLCVRPSHEHQGIGRRMVQFVEDRAREMGLEVLMALSTQAFNFFRSKAGFREGAPDDLPPARRERYEQSGRRSKILVKALKAETPAAPAS